MGAVVEERGALEVIAEAMAAAGIKVLGRS